MRVEINVNPLGWGHSGIGTYLANVIPILQSDRAMQLSYTADRKIDRLALAGAAVVNPRIQNLKTQTAWEAVSYPLHTLKTKADVIHLPYHCASSWSGGRRVLTIHDCSLWENQQQLSRSKLLYRQLLKFASKQAHIVLTDSIYSKTQIERLFGIASDRIIVHPLAASPDLAVPRSADTVQQFRSRFDLAKPYILYAGGTAPHKGILQLVRAYTLLDEDVRMAFDLVLVGQFNQATAHHLPIFDAVSGLSGRGRVVMTGSLTQEDLGTAYHAANLFVFPSFYEGFGLSPLEAMACGAPVIASNRTSIPEVVGDAAIVVDPEDCTALAAAIASVVGSLELQQSMRMKSLERAKEFSWTRTAQVIGSAYAAALK